VSVAVGAQGSRVVGGWGAWGHGFRAMTRWEFSGLRQHIPLMIVVQVVVGAGFVLGISLFFRETPRSVALFVSTGVPVLNLLVVGLIFAPQIVADQKTEQGYEWLRALPVPKSAAAAAWYVVELVIGVAGVAASLLIAHLYYGLDYTFTIGFLAAVLATSFTGTMMGYALAHGVHDPMAIRLVTQLIVFLMMGFAPILYPISQMPSWLAAVNWWFPFRHMAAIMRAGLMPGLQNGVVVSYAIVLVWGFASAIVAARALSRRG
jgi:ABC-2 type transport system permease protein